MDKVLVIPKAHPFHRSYVRLISCDGQIGGCVRRAIRYCQ